MKLFLQISGLVAWGIALFCLFWLLRKGLRDEAKRNDDIYQDELRDRYSEDDDRYYESHINW